MHIYKAIESDYEYLDDQLDSQRVMVLASQPLPSAYLGVDDTGLLPPGQGSGLNVGSKAAEAAVGLVELAASGVDGKFVIDSGHPSTGTAALAASARSDDPPTAAEGSPPRIKVSDFIFVEPGNPSSTEREFDVIIYPERLLISGALILMFYCSQVLMLNFKGTSKVAQLLDVVSGFPLLRFT